MTGTRRRRLLIRSTSFRSRSMLEAEFRGPGGRRLGPGRRARGRGGRARHGRGGGGGHVGGGWSGGGWRRCGRGRWGNSRGGDRGWRRRSLVAIGRGGRVVVVGPGRVMSLAVGRVPWLRHMGSLRGIVSHWRRLGRAHRRGGGRARGAGQDRVARPRGGDFAL